jgi:hypothetical protein
MPRHIEARARIALLFYSTINVVLFTAGVYAVTMFPPLTPDAGFWLAVFTGAGLVVTAPVAWCVGRCVPEAWRKKIMAEPSPLASAPTRTV